MRDQLSIIILNYNTFDYTIKCIESIHEFAINLNFEIILVDNGSTDTDPNIFKERFCDITLICSSYNLGFSKGVNLGIKHANGEFILLLNSDVELVETGLAGVLAKLKEEKQIGALSCKVTFPDGRIQSVANRFPSIKKELIEILRLQKFNPSGSWLLGFFFNHLHEREADWIWGTFFLFRKEILSILPNQRLAEDYFMYFEDVLWCHQITEQGYKIIYYPDYRIVHHLSANSKNSNEFEKMRVVMKNEVDFLRRLKGSLSTRIILLLRAVKYLTLRGSKNKRISKLYWKLHSEFC